MPFNHIKNKNFRLFSNHAGIFSAILISVTGLSLVNIAVAGNSQAPKTVIETFDLIYEPQSSPYRKKTPDIPQKLRPELSGKKWSNGEYTIDGKGIYEYGKPCFSIEYKVDLKNKSYTLKPVANHNLDDSHLKLQAKNSKTNPIALKKGVNADFNNEKKEACEIPLSSPIFPQTVSPGTYDVTVSLRTRDIPNWTITKTSDRLRWYVYSSGMVYWLYWSVNWYAVNPSPIDTHWYISQQNHFGPTYGAGNLNVTKGVYGSYYNYDWGWDHLSTNVSQNVSVQGNNNATVTYSWSHTDSGEDSVFIWGVITLE